MSKSCNSSRITIISSKSLCMVGLDSSNSILPLGIKMLRILDSSDPTKNLNLLLLSSLSFSYSPSYMPEVN